MISSIRSTDLRLIDDLVDFVRGPGFVLDFSDASFADFFASEQKADINDPIYAVNGRSKGKRLRYFLQSCNDTTAVRTLTALWEHRSEHLARIGGKDPDINAEAHYKALINRLRGEQVDGRFELGSDSYLLEANGLDLYDKLEREIPLTQVLERKVCRAAETGSPFVRVHSLFPH